MPAAKGRPPGWGPDRAIELAEQGSIKDRLRELSGAHGLHWRTLYHDIARWKKTKDGFRERYDAAMGGGTRPGGRPPTDAGKLATFLAEFARTGFEAEAAKKAGVHPSTIYHKRTLGQDLYDPVFAEEYERVYRGVLSQIADVPVQIIMDPDVEARTRAQTALKYLERRDPAQFGRRVDIDVTGRIEHHHQHQLDEIQTTQLIERMLGGFFKTGSVPGPKLLEAEFEEVKRGGR